MSDRDFSKMDGDMKGIAAIVSIVGVLVVALLVVVTVYAHFGDIERQHTLQTKIHACEKAPQIKECIVIVAPPN